ncbi:WXG100 family type VII secretion target [Streptomyces sp. NPDC056661]|uniref:WXG100 family type VII secretion target n=1 Tax=Streptomyces sp. NPDC056661 TaxID=3345898 RepID=UPI00368FA351
MDHGESGSGTPFESMSHEEMLTWLDQANSGAIQSAADRLVSAATEIRKIAEDLKVRPQWVEWKGEGADAFRTWSADLANSTLRLGDYSEGASKWLTQASNAIASAQAAIPRTQAGAQANLDAALAARNDPDASAVAQKSAETLIATQEANRQEAAAQMRKLAQTYSLSASQMDGLEKPAFPPPPQAIVPPDEDRRGGEGNVGLREAGQSSRTTGKDYGLAAEGQSRESSGGVATPSRNTAASQSLSNAPVSRPVGMEIDGVTALQDAPKISSVSPSGVPAASPSESIFPATGVVVPPTSGGGLAMPSSTGVGRSTGVPRTSIPGTGAGPLGSGPIGRPPGGGGITGGRVVPQTPGRPVGGIPRGTVIGGEGTQGRVPMGRAMGAGGMGTGIGPGQSGMSGGRRLAGETGGIVGGRSQQPGRTSTRPFTPGGSGLVRAATSTESVRGTGSVGRGAPLSPHGSRTSDSRREAGGERPDYLTEDEETWQQGARRVVPPVID